MKRLLLLCPVLGAVFLTGCLGLQKPAPLTHYGALDGAGSRGAHAVAEGETLYKISGRYKIAMRDIVLANDLQAPFVVKPGQRLILPPPQEYKVKPGDSVSSVARLFAVQPSQVSALNNLRAPYRLKPGQVLRLPSAQETVYDAPSLAAAVIKPVEAEALLPAAAGKAAGGPPPAAPSVQMASVVPPSPHGKSVLAKIGTRTPPRSSSHFLTPVKGTVISAYGPKQGGLHNDGINIAAPRGTPVAAAENGVVVYAGNELKGYGNLVLIRHADRWMTAYAHLDSIAVKRGETIERGATLGTVGSTGSVDTPQLHFEIRRGTDALNPQPYMGV